MNAADMCLTERKVAVMAGRFPRLAAGGGPP
jgi:hypothetical protein